MLLECLKTIKFISLDWRSKFERVYMLIFSENEILSIQLLLYDDLFYIH